MPNTIVKKITIGTPVNVHASAGSRTIDNLGGVDTTSKQQGQILVYDSSQGVGGSYTTSNLTGANGITTSFNAGTDTMSITLDGTTSNVPEGTRLYYTTARADSAFDDRLATKTTNDLAEGNNVNRRYFTDARVDSNIKNADTEVADNVKITFGDDSDLKIYHDTSNSIIRDDGTGSLIIASNNVNLRNQSMTETLASFLAGGSVTLNYNDIAKLRTDSNGATIFGRLSVDSIVGKYIGFDSDFNAKSTTDLSEGSNLYYTRARMDSDHLNVRTHLIPLHDSSFDLGSSSKKWKDLYLSGKTIHLGGLKISDSSSQLLVVDSSGNPVNINLEGAKGAIRGFITTVDAGGDGSFTYDSADGRFTYTGPSAAEVRAHFTGNKGLTYNSSSGNFDVDSANIRGMFSAGGDLSYNSGTGQFSFDVEQVYTKANFDSDLGDANTGQLPEGSNLYHTTARARASVSGDKGLTYNSSTGVMDVDSSNIRGMFSGGTGITYNSGTGAFTTTDGDIVHDNLSGFVANEHIDHTGVSIVAGKGLSGGGTIASSRTIDIDSANVRGMFSGTNGISYTSGTGAIRAPQPLDSSANPTFNQLRGPATFIIDPAAVGDNTGTVRILGDLTVEGVTTTINSTTLSVNDKNIQIADSAADSSALDGGGITWGGTAVTNSPTFNYSHSNARFEANRDIATNLVGNVTGNITGNVLGAAYIQRPHSTSTVNFTTTVVSKDATHRYNGTGSGNAYAIDGVQSPFLELTPGRTYRFTLSSGDMTSHPFRFYYQADKGGAGQYTTNVTSTSTYTEITVTDATPPVLHYQCSAHGQMGNAVFTNARNFTGFTTADLTENTNLYHTTARARSAVSGSTGISYNSSTGVITSNDGQIVHDNLSGFVANEHIDHSAVSIIAGKGLVGGGTLASNRTIDIDSDNIKSFSVEAISGNKGLTYNSSTGVMDVDSANLVALARGAISGGSGISISSGVIKLDSSEFLASYSTSNLPEGTNLYYTQARSDSDAGARIASTSTDSISEGSTNLYLTNERIDDRIAALLIGGTNITVTYSDDSDKLRIDGATGASGYDLAANDTDDLSEGSSNLYFANSRARAAISGNKGLTYNSSTGVMDVDSANLVTLSRAGISVTGEGSYNSTTGVITLPTLGTHYIDSAIGLTLIDANALDSGRGLALIDANALDSGRAIGLIDSAYVQLRQTSAVGDGGIAMAIALG